MKAAAFFLTGLLALGSIAPVLANQENSAIASQVDEAAAPKVPEAPSVTEGFDDIPIVSATPTSRIGQVPPYTSGPEYVWKTLRFRPLELIPEMVLTALIFVYVTFSIFGSSLNSSNAKNWFKVALPVLKEQFAVVGTDALGSIFTADGNDDYVGYATGRRSVKSLQINVQTKPRHDPLLGFYYLGRSLYDIDYRSGSNRLIMTFKLDDPIATPGAKFVFSITRRDGMKAIRDYRWDLRTFASVVEYSGLPTQFVVQTETGDATNALLKNPETGLLDALQDGQPGAEYLEYLVISDMPAKKPEDFESTSESLPTNIYTLTLSFVLPPSSKHEETLPWIVTACNLADVLCGKSKLIPEVAISKARKRRQEASEGLRKVLKEEIAEAEKEEKEALLAKRKKLEEEAWEKKLSSMSKEDRIKAIEKQKEQERKKSMMKMSKKNIQKK